MNWRRAVVAPLVIAGGLCTVIASAEPLKIRLGVIDPPADLGNLLFTKKDVLKHFGQSYVAEATRFTGTSLTATALAAGQIDVASMATPAMALAIQNAGQREMRIIADQVQDGGVPGGYSSAAMVLKDGPVKTIADMKGRIAGTPAFGSAIDIGLRIMLRRQGLEAGRDYKVIQVANPNMRAFLAQGKADLVTVSTPQAYDPEMVAITRTLFSRKDVWGGPSETIYWTSRDDFMKAHRAEMVDFLEDMLRAIRWYTDPGNRREALEIVSAATKQPVATLDTWLFTKDRDLSRDPNGTPNIESIQRELREMKSNGFINVDIDALAQSDLSLVREAAGRLK